jgi:hypothetical protein
MGASSVKENHLCCEAPKETDLNFLPNYNVITSNGKRAKNKNTPHPIPL